MQTRIAYNKLDSNVVQGILGLGGNSGLEESLLDLVKVRASQINRCAFCLDMHIKDARTSGETEQRLYSLSAWHETSFYSERERAALAFAEAVTLISENGVPDEVYEQVRQHFSEQEIVSLTMTVIAINAWNRLNVSLRTVVPGHYKSRRQSESVAEVR
ncbi:MAG: carboxymuconolactone decarboxylase family protein [Burkholderiales bacterium]|nr:carboxymuconolactone decarboxylase family protein [Anaerolineae bacterium]